MNTPKTTSSEAVHAVKPIPCSLPDPENAYTIEQVRENLIEMEAQLASYPVNLSRGPGWVRQQILSMLDRGIVPDKCEPTQISEREELAIQRLAVAMFKIDELKRELRESKISAKDGLPFEILRHSTDSNGRPVVDIFGTYFSNSDACKLRDELNRLLKD